MPTTFRLKKAYGYNPARFSFLLSFLFSTSCFLFVSFTLSNDNSGWNKIADLDNSVSIMTRITKCDSTQIVHLALDNKSKQDQNIKVFVQVLKSKDSDKSFAKLIQYKASGLKITKSTCENSIPALQLSLPPDYDPEQIIFKTITQAY